MTVIEAKNPVLWVNRNIIDLEVLVEGQDEFLPFTATPNDKEVHGREIFERAMSGEFGELVEKVHVSPENTRPTEPTHSELIEKLLRKVEALENKIEEMDNAT